MPATRKKVHAPIAVDDVEKAAWRIANLEFDEGVTLEESQGYFLAVTEIFWITPRRLRFMVDQRKAELSRLQSASTFYTRNEGWAL